MVSPASGKGRECGRRHRSISLVVRVAAPAAVVPGEAAPVDGDRALPKLGGVQ